MTFHFQHQCIFSICKFFGVKVTLLHADTQKSSRESFCDDLVEIITVFCSRIHGQRSHANRLRRQTNSQCSTLINNLALKQARSEADWPGTRFFGLV